MPNKSNKVINVTQPIQDCFPIYLYFYRMYMKTLKSFLRQCFSSDLVILWMRSLPFSLILLFREFKNSFFIWFSYERERWCLNNVIFSILKDYRFWIYLWQWWGVLSSFMYVYQHAYALFFSAIFNKNCY